MSLIFKVPPHSPSDKILGDFTKSLLRYLILKLVICKYLLYLLEHFPACTNIQNCNIKRLQGCTSSIFQRKQHKFTLICYGTMIKSLCYKLQNEHPVGPRKFSDIFFRKVLPPKMSKINFQLRRLRTDEVMEITLGSCDTCKSHSYLRWTVRLYFNQSDSTAVERRSTCRELSYFQKYLF